MTFVPKPLKRSYLNTVFNFKYGSLKKREDKILILGCGRSGTTYTSELFRINGIDINHEKMGKDGMSSWYAVSEDQYHFNTPGFNFLKEYNFNIVHQVRNPLDNIASMLTATDYSWKFIANEIPITYGEDSKLLMAMKYWYYWNKLSAEKASFTYRIEDIHEVFPKLLSLANFKVDPSKIDFSISKKTNSRKHRKVNKEDLIAEDAELTAQIFNLSKHYGYDQ